MMKPHLSIPFKARDAITYVTLPRIIPRLRQINLRFPFVAYLMAVLFGSIGLLPMGHNYLNAGQIGTYSVRQVIIEAARNLKFTWSHIDQVIMFGVLVAGMGLLIVQFTMMIGFLAIGVAQATGVAPTVNPVGFTSMFATPNPTNDIAMMLLDRVFGVPGYFNSCISTAATCEPTSTYLTPAEPAQFPEPHQIALQALFGYYSTGAMAVGGAIVLYFIAAVILESVQTGVPFGKRFASGYAPIRLCLAVLMLVPLPSKYNNTEVVGFNAAQYLTLYMAGVGSGFGTNLWNVFNNTFVMRNQTGVTMIDGYGPIVAAPPTRNGGNVAATLIAMPKAPHVDQLLQFMFIAQSCRAMYLTKPMDGLYPRGANGDRIPGSHPFEVRPYVMGSNGYMPIDNGGTLDQALAISDKGNLKIRFGIENPDTGSIEPFCGELMLRINDRKNAGPMYMQQTYFDLVKQLWSDDAIEKFGERAAEMLLVDGGQPCGIPVPFPQSWGTCDPNQSTPQLPKADYYEIIRAPYQAIVDAAVEEARNKQIAAMRAPVDNRILNRGWAGAGIWYNKLVEMNGTLFDGTHTVPDIRRMPESMEKIAKQRRAGSQSITQKDRYTPAASMGRIDGETTEIGAALNQVYLYFQNDNFTRADLSSQSGNIIFDLMNALFGTQPLFDMRKDPDINPLVQMTGLGKSIVDAAFFNILAGGAIEFGGGVLSQMDGWQKFGSGITTMGDAWFNVAMLGLGIGLMLYYVIPFMPFIYFFFSVVKWLQSIFEAMIGAPMWALAHLRIDGDGIPPDAAENGYHLIFEILLRPALTIFGMIASFMIFTGMIYTLNDIFDLLTVNLTGYNPPSTGSAFTDLEIKRGTIDQFFYTVMYAVLVYIIALGSFKLIDQIPAQILRWMGSGAKNIIDEAGDPAPKLIQSIYVGSFGLPLVQQGGMIGDAVKGIRQGLQQGGQALGSGLKGAVKPGNAGVSSDEG